MEFLTLERRCYNTIKVNKCPMIIITAMYENFTFFTYKSHSIHVPLQFLFYFLKAKYGIDGFLQS